MSADELLCPQCSAPMVIDAAALKARCEKCGAVRDIQPVGESQVNPGARTRENLGAPPWALQLFLAGIASAALIFPVLKWWAGRIAPQTLETHKPPAAPAKFAWDVTTPPIFRDLNGDGIDDLIGRIRDDAAKPQLHVAAFDGATLKPLWTSASLGDWADALTTVQLAITGNALLYTDSIGGVELHDAATNAMTKRLALPGPATQACAAPDGTVKFWVATQTGQGVFVEPNVPQPTPAARPSWCPAQRASGPSAHVLSNASAPGVPGFTPSLVLNDGTDAVAVGLESGLPTLVGFDPSRPGVRWKSPVSLDSQGIRKAAPLGSDLVQGVAYVPYQIDRGRRLLAVEMSTGKPRWDIAIPGQGLGTQPWERIIATGARVFVPGALGLSVYDAHSGKQIGLLGR